MNKLVLPPRKWTSSRPKKVKPSPLDYYDKWRMHPRRYREPEEIARGCYSIRVEPIGDNPLRKDIPTMFIRGTTLRAFVYFLLVGHREGHRIYDMHRAGCFSFYWHSVREQGGWSGPVMSVREAIAMRNVVVEEWGNRSRTQCIRYPTIKAIMADALVTARKQDKKLGLLK